MQDDQDQVQEDAPPPAPEPEPSLPPSAPPAAPASSDPGKVSLGRLRAASMALTGHPSWVVNGVARSEGWDDDTEMTREAFNDAIKAWLQRPVEGVGSTAPADTTS